MGFEYGKYTKSGGFMRFDEIGDSIEGEVLIVQEGNDFNGNPCPELIIETPSEGTKTVTAGQAMLKVALAEKQPQKGDRVRITYSGHGEGKPGRAPSKLFEVVVEKAGATAPVSAEDLA